MQEIDWSFDAWPAIEPRWGAAAAEKPDDTIDFHVDLGCGKMKKGRIGVDRYPTEQVNVCMDLDSLVVDGLPREPGGAGSNLRPPLGLEVSRQFPFPSNSIESIISHHTLEHIGAGFIPLMDECWRVLKSGAPFRIIVPLFPSTTAVEDPDHKRMFMEHTLDAFCGEREEQDPLSAFSQPYTKARFRRTDLDVSPPAKPERQWRPDDRRELRCTLRAVK